MAEGALDRDDRRAPADASPAGARCPAPANLALDDPERRDRRRLWLLLGGLAAWSIWFIAGMSQVVEGKRVFILFDDAMISMTYARNLVDGYGLNWARAGAPVEGFTHPLWTAMMVPVNALPLDLRYRSVVVELLSLGILLLHVVLVRRLMLRFFSTERARHWLPAALLTAFYYPLNFWALSGMESGLQALLTTASVLLALDVVCRGEDRHRELLLVGAAAYLLRMDMLLMVAVAQVYVMARGGLRQTRLRAGWWQGISILLGAVAGYSVFRWFYFRDVLPNTYYLKLYKVPLGFRLQRGIRTLGESLSDHLPLVALFLVVLLMRHVFRRWRQERGEDQAQEQAHDGEFRRRLWLPVALFLAACAYSVYVGGDAWEMSLNVRANRFVVYVMPQLFIVLNALINEVAGAVATGAARRRVLALTTVVALLSADGLWLAADTGENWMDLAAMKKPRLVVAQGGILRHLRKLQAVLGPTGVVATYLAGSPAYFSDYQMVDVLGYNERHIARLPPIMPVLPDSYDQFWPGHVKWDYAYVLARYHPVAIMTPLAVGPHGSPWRLLMAAGYHYCEDGFFLLSTPQRKYGCVHGGRPQVPRSGGSDGALLPSPLQ